MRVLAREQYTIAWHHERPGYGSRLHIAMQHLSSIEHVLSTCSIATRISEELCTNAVHHDTTKSIMGCLALGSHLLALATCSVHVRCFLTILNSNCRVFHFTNSRLNTTNTVHQKLLFKSVHTPLLRSVSKVFLMSKSEGMHLHCYLSLP